MAETRLLRLLKKEFSLESNLLANFAGNGIVAAASLVALPFYLPLIGVEAYGLIGLFVALQAILSVLDLGLSVTLTRELAVRSSGTDAAGSRDLVRTTETIYWIMAAVIALVGAAAAPWLADFVNPKTLSAETLRDCFLLIVAALAFQFPVALYTGGLYGLQRQVLVSAIAVFFAIFKNFGVLAVLIYVRRTPQAFFAWQAIGAALQAAAVAVSLWLILPKAEGRARFRAGLIGRTWKFTAGIGAISVASILITQVDKIVLARILSLEAFGYYVIAAVVSGSLQRVVQPVFQAYFPKFSQLAGGSDEDSLRSVYHRGCQLLAAIVLPIASILVFFAREVVSVWQRDATTVENTFVLVSMLVAGSALNALLFVPYALQIAYGWTKLHLYSISAAVAASVPLTVILGRAYGAPGAAAVWIAINVGFVLIIIPIMHQRLLRGEMLRWYVDDVAKPMAAAVAIAAVCRYFYVAAESPVLIALQLAIALAMSFAGAVAASSEIRAWVVKAARG